MPVAKVEERHDAHLAGMRLAHQAGEVVHGADGRVDLVVVERIQSAVAGPARAGGEDFHGVEAIGLVGVETWQ